MEVRPHSSSPARNLRGRSLGERLSPGLIVHRALWATLLLLLGCGSAANHSDSPSSSMVVGERAVPIPSAQLAVAAEVAHRFAAAYARSAYLLRPPQLPGATGAVDRDLAIAAGRVPRSRRRLHPHLAALHLAVSGRRSLDAGVTVADGRFPPFSVGFTVRRRGVHWLVVSISTPE